jgi:fatty acid desaturase
MLTATKFSFMLKRFWRLWAKALGEKASVKNKEADRVAAIRTAIVVVYLITNFCIIVGIIRHW